MFDAITPAQGTDGRPLSRSSIKGKPVDQAVGLLTRGLFAIASRR